MISLQSPPFTDILEWIDAQVGILSAKISQRDIFPFQNLSEASISGRYAYWISISPQIAAKVLRSTTPLEAAYAVHGGAEVAYFPAQVKCIPFRSVRLEAQ